MALNPKGEPAYLSGTWSRLCLEHAAPKEMLCRSKLPNPGGLRNTPTPTPSKDVTWASPALASRIRSPKQSPLQRQV